MTKGKRRAPDISLSEIKTRVRSPLVEVGERKPALLVGETLVGIGPEAPAFAFPEGNGGWYEDANGKKVFVTARADKTTVDRNAALDSTITDPNAVSPRLTLQQRIRAASYLGEPLMLSADEVKRVNDALAWAEQAHAQLTKDVEVSDGTDALAGLYEEEN